MSVASTIRERFNALMKSKNINLEAIPTEEAAPLEMKKTGKLKDGTEVYSTGEDFVVDGDLFVTGENGPMPAPDGEHILDDDRVIVVAGGKITEIREVVEEDLTAEQLMAAVEELTTKLAAANTEVETLKTELAAVKTTDNTKATEIVSLKARVKELEKQPAAPSVTDNKAINLKKENTAPEKTWAQMTVEERIRYSRINSVKN